MEKESKRDGEGKRSREIESKREGGEGDLDQYYWHNAFGGN